MSKLVLHEQEARAKIIAGVDFLADAVKVTEGPRGRIVILGQRALGMSPKCTRDGVTVSNYVDPTDPTEQMGADLIREACQKTDNVAGDGTTATATLAQAMIHSGFDKIGGEWDFDADARIYANPLAMERGIHKAVDLVISQLRYIASPATPEQVFQVATVSAHGDVEIGRLVAQAIETAGRDGIVTAEPSTTSETHVDTVPGLELEKSNLISPAFITHPEEMKAELHECRILLWEGVLASAKSLAPILNQVLETNTPLLIVAGGYEAEALAIIILARTKKGLPIVAVRMEHYGDRRREVMRDIAVLTGGQAYTEDLGIKIDSVKLTSLGIARKVVVDMSKTQIVEGRGKQDELVGRLNNIRASMESVPPSERATLKRRLAALQGGITVIKVGGVTVTEMEEKRDRVIDALSAAKAAIAEGVVPGGGTALLQARAGIAAQRATVDDDELPGFDVVDEACCAVAGQIAENAGLDREEVLSYLEATPNIGFNAMNGKYEDLFEIGILDPVRVVIESLKNAAAVSCSLLTMGATVSEILPTEKN